GLVATREAMDQAGLPARLEGTLAEETGVILGTGLGGVGTLVEGIAVNTERGPDRISPFFIPYGIPNVGAGMVAIAFGPLGPNFTTASACATGGHAIGEAWETIRRGDADVMLAGGTEAGVFEALVGGFCAMRALSSRNDDPTAASRPFDAGRDGFVIGEGAAVVVTITANKSMIGHTLGAAGAIEAIATIQTIRDGCVPPTINLEDPDEASKGLDIVRGAARSMSVEVALSNSFGFGGQNSALVFRRWRE